MGKFVGWSNPGEYGLFRGMARTRRRLLGAVIAASALTFGAAWACAYYVNEVSDSVGLNMILIAAVMTLALGAAYLQALLIGDLFFPGPWREQVILGRAVRGEAASIKNHTAEFVIVLIGLMIANALVINYGSGGSIQDYHERGFFRARLRSDDPLERVAALRDMADLTQYALWEKEGVRALVRASLDDPHPEVRAQAAWSAGAIGAIGSEEELERLALAEREPAQVRAEALVSLGRLKPPGPARGAIEAIVIDPSEPLYVRLGAARALALWGDAESFEALREAAESAPDALIPSLYWAIRRGRSPEAAAWLRSVFDAEPGALRRCAAGDALKLVAGPEQTLWARQRFLAEPAEASCPERVVWEERDERTHVVSFGDPPRAKLVKIVAAGDPAAYRSWFQRVVNDASEPWPVRQAADDVLKTLARAAASAR